MKVLSSMRNDSSTAFLIHWWVTHTPLIFSATRSLPWSRYSMTVLMVSFSCASTLRGVISARRSKASSMMACNCGMVFPNLIFEFLGEFGDASCGFQRLVQVSDQRQADEVCAGVDPVCFAGKEAAGQHG